MFGLEGATLENVAHIIQVALTPIFLLSGIASLLNVFATRLARVSDKVDQMTEALAGAGPEEAARLSVQLAFNRRRSVALDVAVVLGAVGGVATCAAALTLFLGALRDATVETALFVVFGAALLSTIGALAAFVFEMLLASRGLRAKANESGSRADIKSGGVDPQPSRTVGAAPGTGSGKTG